MSEKLWRKSCDIRDKNYELLSEIEKLAKEIVQEYKEKGIDVETYIDACGESGLFIKLYCPEEYYEDIYEEYGGEHILVDQL
jgi:hypothetical protein